MKIGRLAAVAALISALVLGTSSRTLAEKAAETNPHPVPTPRAPNNHPFPKPLRAENARESGGTGSSFRWGGIGFVLALVGLSAVVLSTRRRSIGTGDETTSLRVAGRVALSPRQAIHLVKVGDRTILIGTGTQGPPSFLGEWSDSPAVAPRFPQGPREGETL